ncbi:hypothetical protein SAMN05421637_2279 [Demequina mangrovi]|uniref:Uncharacterized protein n=2 Tax=Demequina mangrovi TaxID=1043493 RepID=A0A1H6ZWU9_9MICO|nr:hypothetical protein SAMN05421637_2279 [Demequina mangrovi]
MRGTRARPATRRTLAAVATLALAMLGTSAAAGAPGPTEVPDELGLEAEVLAAPAALLEDGDDVSATVAVENLGTTDVDDALVVLRLTRQPFADRAALAQFLAGEPAAMKDVGRQELGLEVTLEPATDETEAETVTRFHAGSSTTVEVDANPERLPFETDAWGVHGVQVELRTETDTSVVFTGAVTWSDAEVPELELATLATASGLSTRARAVASASNIDGVTLAVDGTALSVLGTSTFDAKARDILTLPAQDPDLVSLAHAEDSALLEYSLERSAEAGSGALAGLPWLGIVGTVDRDTIALAAAQGARALLVTEDAVDGQAGDVTPAARLGRGGGSRLPLLSPDSFLSGYAVADASLSPGAVGLSVAAGALTAAGADGPVLVWTGDTWTPGDAGATEALTALLSAPFVAPVSVTALAREEDLATYRPEQTLDAGDDLGAPAIAGLRTRLADLIELSAVAEDPDAIMGPGGQAVLSPLTRSLRGDEVARDLRLTEATTSIDETLDALHVAAGSDINFIADKGALPVTVVNDLDVEATVVVDMTSFSPNLQIRDAPTVTVPPRSTTTVPVEVSAVSTANVRARTVLRNVEGAAIAAPVTMSVRVRADWGTAVTAVFTVGLIAMLVLGVIRTIRRGRKDTRTAQTGDGEA